VKKRKKSGNPRGILKKFIEMEHVIFSKYQDNALGFFQKLESHDFFVNALQRRFGSDDF